jgi:hypothetical protein
MVALRFTPFAPLAAATPELSAVVQTMRFEYVPLFFQVSVFSISCRILLIL